MAKCLCTGGAGFLGSHVADELLKMGHEVVVLDDLSGGFVENVPIDAEFVEGTICSPMTVRWLFACHKFDYVFHLAAYAAEGLSHHIKRFNYENNLLGSVNLINAAINYGVKRFVFTSSIAVYGVPTRLPVVEDDPCNPIDPYGIAKLAVEQELKASQRYFGLDYTIFRPHNVYGERQNIGDRYRNVVGIFMNQCLKGEPMTIFGDGTQTRAFTYVGDIAYLIAKSVDNPLTCNQIFNVGTKFPCSVKDLAYSVAYAMESVCRIGYLPARDEIHAVYADHTKLENVFGPTLRHGLTVGLLKMAAWVRKHGPRQSQPFKDIEVLAKLPEVWK